MRFVQQFCFIMRGINASSSVGLGSWHLRALIMMTAGPYDL